MDKFLTLLGPHQLRGGVNGAEEVQKGARAVLRQPFPGIGGIEKVLPALPILDALLAQNAVQLHGGHAHALCHLRGGEARYGVQHLVGIVRLRFQPSNLLVPPHQGGVCNLQGAGHNSLIALVGAYHHVSPLLAYGKAAPRWSPTCGISWHVACDSQESCHKDRLRSQR